ncbi:hypothetical protein V1477_012934 [Vespula maculifrons]|uniref:Uncharacterized protein n=1 Tax=Vespula maculifrons TaxID=7453 RepID=A0ABD2BUP9_VESMC
MKIYLLFDKVSKIKNTVTVSDYKNQLIYPLDIFMDSKWILNISKNCFSSVYSCINFCKIYEFFLYILSIFSNKQSHLITISIIENLYYYHYLVNRSNNLILKYDKILFSYLVQSNRLINRVISIQYKQRLNMCDKKIAFATTCYSENEI